MVLHSPTTQHLSIPCFCSCTTQQWATPAVARFRKCSTPNRQHTQRCHAVGTPEDEDRPQAGPDSLLDAFNREVQQRSQDTVTEAADFDGQALLELLRARYGRSYDVSLVQRTYLGQTFVALNIMWKYAEQQSWTYTEEEYMERLDLVAAALRAWDKVQVVKDDVMARKERPRVGKAVSIMLDLNETQWKEWFVL